MCQCHLNCFALLIIGMLFFLPLCLGSQLEAEFFRSINPGKLLMRPDWFAEDPVPHLMMQLATDERLTAVGHIIRFNGPELTLVIERMKEALNIFTLLTLASSRHPPRRMLHTFMTPLAELVSNYVTKRPGRCMYDYVPMELRDTSKYDDMFAEVAEITARQGDVDGVTGYLTRESLGSELHDWKSYVIGATVSSDVSGLLRIDRGGSLLFIDSAASCGATVNSRYRDFVMDPKRRGLLVQDRITNEAVIWRGDSAEALRLPVLPTAVLGFLVTDLFYYVGYQVPFPRHARLAPEGKRFVKRFNELFPDYATLPGFIYMQYSNEEEVESEAFRIPFDEEASLQPIPRSFRAMPGFADLRVPLVEYSSFGQPIKWKQHVLLSVPSGEVALCDAEADTFFRGLENDMTNNEWANGKLSNAQISLGLYLLGSRDLERAPSLTQNQRTLKNIVKLISMERGYEAWVMYQSSALTSIPQSDLVANVVTDKAPTTDDCGLM